MARVILDVCPKCKTDVSRRFGVITTPTIVCPKCSYEMRVTANAVVNSWQFNVVVGVALVLWLFTAAAILCSRGVAAEAGARLGLPARTIQNRLVMALFSGMPALLVSLPFALVGRAIGHSVADRLLSGSDKQTPAAGPSPPRPPGPLPGRRGLQMDSLVPDGAASGVQQPPGGIQWGTFFLRAVVGLVWFVVFFVIGSISISALVTMGMEADAPTRQKAIEQAGRVWGLWVFFGSILLVVVLGKLGWLPGMGRRKVSGAGSKA